MSQEQARALIERMKSDQAFREKVYAVGDVEGRLALVHAEGYDCSAEEIARERPQSGEDELDRVAGGDSCGGLDDPVYTSHTADNLCHVDDWYGNGCVNVMC